MRATTIRMEDTVLDRVDSMAKSVNRSRTWLINQAVEQFLSYEEWFVQEVQAGVNEVANGELASQGKVRTTFCQVGCKCRLGGLRRLLITLMLLLSTLLLIIQ